MTFQDLYALCRAPLLTCFSHAFLDENKTNLNRLLINRSSNIYCHTTISDVITCYWPNYRWQTASMRESTHDQLQNSTWSENWIFCSIDWLLRRQDTNEISDPISSMSISVKHDIPSSFKFSLGTTSLGGHITTSEAAVNVHVILCSRGWLSHSAQSHQHNLNSAKAQLA